MLPTTNKISKSANLKPQIEKMYLWLKVEKLYVNAIKTNNLI